MKSRASPSFGVALSLVLMGTGTCRALSLKGSAAELSLGDVLPGTVVAGSKDGARLRVENSGSETVRVGLKVVSPPPQGLKDGWEPWPYPERVRAELSRARLMAGEASDVDIRVKVPDKAGLSGGQYQFDVLETGTDPAGASLTLKTRVLLSVGAPLPSADSPAGGFAERPGFALAPRSASGKEAVVKIVNAGDEDLTVTFSPAREWNDDVRIREGYEPAPNPRWLRFESGAVKVRAGAIGRARMWASVPREERYAGRRWAFVAAVDAVSGGRRTRRYFVLYANTRDLEEETRAP